MCEKLDIFKISEIKLDSPFLQQLLVRNTKFRALKPLKCLLEQTIQTFDKTLNEKVHI